LTNKKTIIIGISGASASGKSLLANTIVNELGSNQVVVISEDSYYKDHSDIPFEERAKINYDHPDSLDHALLHRHLQQLQAGEHVDVPLYNHSQHTRDTESRSIGQHTIIVLEGILLFVEQNLRDLMDIRIFMETALDICLIRRLKRDVKERGRTLDCVLKQYEDTVRPMYLQFIEPSKRYADIIVPRGGGNRIAIDMIKAKMRELLGDQPSTEKNHNPL
jgi:uridine kinase